MRASIEEHSLLTVANRAQPAPEGESPVVMAGKPLCVTCRFSAALKSELARPIKLPVDKRYKRKAFLVALDAELLRRCGQGRGLNAQQAAKLKPLARPCQCARKVPVSDNCEVDVILYPQHFPAGTAQVLLQVVVESSVDNTYWACFGGMELVRVMPGDQDSEQLVLGDLSSLDCDEEATLDH